MDALKTLYANYYKEAEAARLKSSLVANFLGTEGSAKRHPCHETFYDNLSDWVAEFIAGEPTGREALAVGTLLLEQPTQYAGKDCYWFMYAGIGLMDGLLPLLSQEEAGELARTFGRLYRKGDRMPIQDRIFKALCKKAGLDSRKVK